MKSGEQQIHSKGKHMDSDEERDGDHSCGWGNKLRLEKIRKH